MFLNRLNPEQKKAFLAIAIKLSGADGRLDQRERIMIESMRYEMGMWSDTDLPTGSIEQIATAFDSYNTKIVAMLEAIAIAYADEEMAGQEKNILREMARIFNFTEEKATTLEQWVLRFIDLQKEAEHMISG